MATINSKKARLFLFVDQTYWSMINIAFRSKDKEEAQEFIESMPIILSNCFCIKTWTWFDKETSNKLMGYKWSAEIGLYAPMEDIMFKDLNQFTKRELLQEITNEDFLNPSERVKMEFEWNFDRITGINKNGPLDTESLGSFRSKANLGADNISASSNNKGIVLDKKIDLSNIKLSTDQLEQLLRSTSVHDTLSTNRKNVNDNIEKTSKKRKEREHLKKMMNHPG